MMPPEKITGVHLDGSPAELDVERMIWRPSVHALIFNEKGELLVLDNLKNGKYDLPGGGIEIWETIPEALVREIWEETGLTAEIGGLVHVEDAFYLTPGGKHWHTVKIFYQATITGGTIRNTILDDEMSMNPHWRTVDHLNSDHFTLGQATWGAIQKCLNGLNGR